MPKERQKSLDRALEEAVSRALRDNLAPLQRTADELHQAYGDLVSACSSSRPSNALPAMLRAQTSASALAAGLSVLSNFVAVALNPRESHGSEERATSSASAVAEMEPEPVAPEPPLRVTPPPEPKSDWAEEPVAAETAEAPVDIPLHAGTVEEPIAAESAVNVEAAAESSAFDISALSTELR